MGTYGMTGYNDDGTYRTGPAEARDRFGRTPRQAREEQEEMRRIIRAQRAAREA